MHDAVMLGRSVLVARLVLQIAAQRRRAKSLSSRTFSSERTRPNTFTRRRQRWPLPRADGVDARGVAGFSSCFPLG
jgi:hypothetical protein